MPRRHRRHRVAETGGQGEGETRRIFPRPLVPLSPCLLVSVPLCLCGKFICTMATEIKLPMLGENVDSGVVINVLVSEGDEVAEGQPVIELETEKATIEVPASASGRV